MHLNVPTADVRVSTGRTNCILLYLTLIYILPSTAYRRKTTVSLDITKPVRTIKKTRKPRGPNKPKKAKNVKKSGDEYDYNEDADADADTDTDEDGDADRDDYDKADTNNDEDTGWLADLKMDPQFAEDKNMFLTTGTPIDLRTNYRPRWTPFTEEELTVTTEVTSTTLMDLGAIGFNETWCTYIEKAETRKWEGEAFIEAVKKLCSQDHAQDNDVRLALRHTIESRKLIDRLMNDISDRLSAKDEEKKKKLINPKHRVTTQNEFCYSRALKSFKYLCFDPDANPYMERYLKILSNACRLPGLDVSDIREHLVDACENINNNLVDVL